MKRHNFVLLFLAVNLAMILTCAAVVRGQTWKASCVWPESLHSFHADSGNHNQDNGGNGCVVTWKHETKGGIDLGIGKIFGTNSHGDPLEITIIQLANADLELWFLKFGVNAWWMRLEGYYNGNGEPFNLDLGPWPVPHVEIAPFYFWERYNWLKKVYVSHVFIPMIGVNASFTAIEYHWRF